MRLRKNLTTNMSHKDMTTIFSPACPEGRRGAVSYGVRPGGTIHPSPVGGPLIVPTSGRVRSDGPEPCMASSGGMQLNERKYTQRVLLLALVSVGFSGPGCGTTVIQRDVPEEDGEWPEDDESGVSSAGADDEQDGETDDEPEPGGDTGNEDEPIPEGCEELDAAVQNLLEDTCSGCHTGEGASAQFDYVTDVEQLVQTGRIVPGDPDASPLMARVAGGQMPPAGVEPRPTEVEIDALEQWIGECVPDPLCEHEQFVPIGEMLETMRADISDTTEIASDERRFHRYFTLTHIYNAGVCSQDLDGQRWALSKAINSLSTETKIVAPVPIDDAQTIYRIDLRDYGWDAALWDSVVSQNPFAVEYVRDEATDLKTFTETNVPFMTGDWFVANASRPPLYHEILQIPANRSQLEQQFGIDVLADIDAEEVERSGFLDSGVSVNNRLIERHEFPGASNRTYWLSYDFASNGGTSNLFAFPLEFVPAGNEVIFSLPNGLHAYMITDGLGNRIDEAPDDIVTDPAQPDQNVVNGLSCMGCHAHGIIPREDELRDHVLDSFEFEDVIKERVNKLHPSADDFEASQALDSDRFLDAVEQTGSPTNLEWEPINTVFTEFDGEVDLRRAAAELGITEVELTSQLGGLGPDLQTLLSGSVKREVFTLNFSESICTLNLGITAACGGPGAPQ